MSELVDRLRMEARRDPEIQHSGHSILSDAADEIERLLDALGQIASQADNEDADLDELIGFAAAAIAVRP